MTFRDSMGGRLRRLATMAPSILQCAAAAALAWVVAKDLLHHPRPFFAPIAVVICIGVALGRRVRRMAEMVAGVSVGVGVGDLLVLRIGSGPLQLALVVALAMAAAVLLDSGQVIVLQAGSSAVLVATLLPPTGSGGLDRMVDALTGGVIGIAAVALLPANPIALAHRHARVVLDELADALEGAAEAIAAQDITLAADALDKVRGSQKAVEDLRAALLAGREIAVLSPLRWNARARLRRYQAAATPVDHALRNTRVLLRRTLAAMRDREPMRHDLPARLRGLADTARLLRDELGAGAEPVRARQAAFAVAEEIRGVLDPDDGFSTHVITAQLRSIAVDLLVATGTDRQTATAALPPSHTPSPVPDPD
ncbi:FUSC family protein [Sphaerisporangium sp. TRM90804]|uniref:FUSC family protein n=1 Tax=Sphaerisporangium sp. TRM90804 TaxID=3031113 RepID=UPI00244B3E95|nr:FUSC family protein [Sphaerisporangium sp. TRM90804]MDH2428045.1 FUSC family protein [Sphaerisporangium sp. TRM90804]